MEQEINTDAVVGNMKETIVAISTPYGSGGIAVIRVSGPQAIEIVGKGWLGADLGSVPSHTAHLGKITSADGEVLDTAVAVVYRGPKSFTGEDTVELSVHGSKWIQREVVETLIGYGARAAEPGEFTRRAFMNGRLDLVQAEAVADVIASSSRAAHRLAVSQMSGSFSKKINSLRDHLVELASLLELELDFSEEDVEFADRIKLREIADETLATISRLVSTYKSGRAFKEGVPVAIAGKPNAGKSTLLNELLQEEKAIVSDIPGTTRDVIEDTVEIDGVLFRFFDTAGLRATDDTVERIGIDRAYEVIGRSSIVVWLIDGDSSADEIQKQIDDIKVQINAHKELKNLVVFTKSDKKEVGRDFMSSVCGMQISAKTGSGINRLKKELLRLAKEEHDPDNELIVTNARHYAALQSGADALRRAREALETNLSADFIAQDIREAIHYLSEVTGEISTDTLLENIFANFCIGK